MNFLFQAIPMPVLYGVFLYMGISSLRGVQVSSLFSDVDFVPSHFSSFQMIDRLLLLFMPLKYQPDLVYLRHVPIKRVHLFTAFQLSCFVVLCVVKEIKITSIVFPLMVSLIFIDFFLKRVFLMHPRYRYHFPTLVIRVLTGSTDLWFGGKIHTRFHQEASRFYLYHIFREKIIFQLVIMVGVRKLMEYVFTEHELKYLDDKMPEITLRKKEDATKKKELLQQEHAQDVSLIFFAFAI